MNVKFIRGREVLAEIGDLAFGIDAPVPGEKVKLRGQPQAEVASRRWVQKAKEKWVLEVRLK